MLPVGWDDFGNVNVKAFWKPLSIGWGQPKQEASLQLRDFLFQSKMFHELWLAGTLCQEKLQDGISVTWITEIGKGIIAGLLRLITKLASGFILSLPLLFFSRCHKQGVYDVESEEKVKLGVTVNHWGVLNLQGKSSNSCTLGWWEEITMDSSRIFHCLEEKHFYPVPNQHKEKPPGLLGCNIIIIWRKLRGLLLWEELNLVLVSVPAEHHSALAHWSLCSVFPKLGSGMPQSGGKDTYPLRCVATLQLISVLPRSCLNHKERVFNISGGHYSPPEGARSPWPPLQASPIPQNWSLKQSQPTSNFMAKTGFQLLSSFGACRLPALPDGHSSPQVCAKIPVHYGSKALPEVTLLPLSPTILGRSLLSCTVWDPLFCLI